jgi:predicted RNA-binding protein
MSYWLIALPREDMEHCIKISTFGANRKHAIGHVQKGDKVACYVTKESKIIALGEATSSYYMDDKTIFKSPGIFPDRFDLHALFLEKEHEVDFRTMVDDFEFITNKFYWTVYLRNGIAKITRDDWELINRRAKQFAPA